MKIAALVLAFFITSQALAAIYSYDYWIPHAIKNYNQQMEASQAPAQGQRSCEAFYQPMVTDGILDIRYALGYFDHSTGEEILDQGINRGYSPSLDIEVFKGLNNAWTAPCTGNLKLCGFTAIGSIESGKIFFQKSLRLHGQDILARITLTQASASDSFVLNKTELAERQKRLTEQSEDNYFGGLEKADIVFYNGHSRDGGGPDFNPPVLNSKNKTNYSGYYQVKQPGFKRMIKALRANPNKDIVVGLFSCFSKLHFYDAFVRYNPKQRMILSSDTIMYLDTLRGSVGYLEGILRGTCGDELSQMARQGDVVRDGFTDWRLAP